MVIGTPEACTSSIAYLGISKRGDSYIRKLMVHGARSVVFRAASKNDKRSLWINKLACRRGINKACVAVANKNVRIAWALLKNESTYQVAA
jgi:transposase